MPFTQIRVNVDKDGSRIDAIFSVSSKNIHLSHPALGDEEKISTAARRVWSSGRNSCTSKKLCKPVTYAGWILISKDWSLIALTRCFRE